MAEGLGAVGSLSGVVGFGLRLATTLQTYVEAVLEAKDRLRDVAFDVNSTASTLKQLQAIIDADHSRATKVLKDEGIKEIGELTVSLGKVYSTIVIILTKAGTPQSRGKVTAESVDPLTLKTSCLTRHMNMKWYWLAPRVKRCQEQLRWLKTKLLLNLQLANLAGVQLGLPERLPGSFQEEMTLRALSLKLRKRELRAFKNLTAKYAVAIDDDSSEASDSFLLDRNEVVDFRDNGKVEDGSEKSSYEVIVIEEHKPARSRTDEPNASELCESSQSDRPGVVRPTETSEQDQTKHDLDGSESGTLVDEPQGGKDSCADLKKPVVDEMIAPVLAEANAESKPEQPKEQQPPSTEITEDGKNAAAVKSSEDDDAVELPSSSGKFSLLPTWLKDLFGKNDKFTHDWESPTLECFIISKEFKLLKAPFGHQRLTYGLKRTQRKIGLSWDQYMALDSHHKKEISKAINKAKASDSRQRTCVAIGAQKKSGADFIVLFMTLGPKVEPVHFKDCVGRVFTFPYESCRTWENMHRLINDAFRDVERIDPEVQAGKFDLLNGKGAIILPDLWSSLVQPDDYITMFMWPPSPQPPRGIPLGPPPLPPPGCPPSGHLQPPAWRGPPAPPGPRPGPPPQGNWPPGPPPPRPPFSCGPPPIQRPPTMFMKPRSPPPLINVLPKKKSAPVSTFGWLADKPSYRYRNRRRSCRSDSESDESELMSDSEIENEEEDIRIAIDFEKEEENAKLQLGDLLGKYTHALDTLGGEDLDSDTDSDSGSSSSSGWSGSIW